MSRNLKVWLAVLTCLGLILALPLTAPGSRFLVGILDGLPGLEVVYLRGSLAGRLSLSKVTVVQGNIIVELQDVELSAANSCLLRSEICLSELNVGRLLVEVSEREGNPPGSSSDAAFVFPVAVSSANVSIDELLLSWPGGTLSSQAIAVQVEIADSRIRIGSLTSHGTTLAIDAVAADTATVDRPSSIALPQLSLPLELLVENLELYNPEWRFGEVQHRHKLLQLSGRWQGTALEIATATLASEQWGLLSTAGHLSFSDNWPVNVEGIAAVEQPPLWVGLHGQNLNYALDGTLAELNVEVDMSGAQSYQLAGSANLLAAELPFDLSMSVSWPDTLLPAQLPGVATEIADIELLTPWVVDVSGTLAKQSLSVAGSARGVGYAGLSLQLQASMENSVLRVQSLALMDEATDSSLAIAGEVFIDQGLSWELDVSSGGLEVPAVNDFRSGRLQGSLISRGTARNSIWQLSFDQLDLRGEIAGSPASAQGYLAVNNEWELQNSALEIQVRKTRLSLSVAGNDKPRIDIAMEDLGAWLEGGRGSLDLSSQLDNGQRLWVFRGSAENLDWQGLRIEKGRIEGSYHLDESGNYDVVAELAAASYRDILLEAVRLSATGNADEAQWALVTQGDIATSLRVAGKASNQDWLGQLDPATLRTPAGQWQLEKPVALKLQSLEQLSVEAHCWRNLDSHICPGQLKLGESGEARIDATADLNTLRLLLPEYMSLVGEAEAFIEASWNPDSGLVASARAKLSAGQLARSNSEDSTAGIRWDRGTVAADLAQGKTTVSADLWREGRRQLNLNLASSAREGLNGALALDNFNLSGTLKPFFQMFSDHSGALSGKLDFSGSLAEPRMRGLLTLSEGEFALVGNPTSFEQFELRLRAQGDRVDLDGELIVGGGETQVSGILLLPGAQGGQMQQQAQLELHLRGQRQTVLLPPGVEATVSEDLTLLSRAGGEQLELMGEIIVHSGVLEAEQLPEGSVDVSSDVVQVDSRGEVIIEQSLFDLIANVNVTIEDDFQVRGSGLETTVGGQLALKKESMKPLQLFGDLNIIDGEIKALGQSFDVKRGNLAFVGDPANPDLNLKAEREISDEKVTVGVHILGSLEAFSFNLYSTPVLPEAEMMSYLIRGRGLDKGADADGTAIALSMGMGAVNRTGVVRELNKIPGISNVSFGTDGDANDTTATVSGYVGKRLYLSYGAGIYEPINVLTARLYLQTRLWLEVVSSLQSSADIYYSFDIE